MEELRRFKQLTPVEQVEARISWLERKMVEVLWLLISLAALLVGAVAAWFAGEAMETRSMWLQVPVFLVVWGVTKWLLQRRTFRGAPPHIDFIDP